MVIKNVSICVMYICEGSFTHEQSQILDICTTLIYHYHSFQCSGNTKLLQES